MSVIQEKNDAENKLDTNVGPQNTRHIEAIQQTFNGTPNFGNRVTCQISRNGDLIHRMYLSVVNYYSGTNASVCPYFGLRLINYVEIEN